MLRNGTARGQYTRNAGRHESGPAAGTVFRRGRDPGAGGIARAAVAGKSPGMVRGDGVSGLDGHAGPAAPPGFGRVAEAPAAARDGDGRAAGAGETAERVARAPRSGGPRRGRGSGPPRRRACRSRGSRAPVRCAAPPVAGGRGIAFVASRGSAPRERPRRPGGGGNGFGRPRPASAGPLSRRPVFRVCCPRAVPFRGVTALRRRAHAGAPCGGWASCRDHATVPGPGPGVPGGRSAGAPGRRRTAAGPAGAGDRGETSQDRHTQPRTVRRRAGKGRRQAGGRLRPPRASGRLPVLDVSGPRSGPGAARRQHRRPADRTRSAATGPSGLFPRAPSGHPRGSALERPADAFSGRAAVLGPDVGFAGDHAFSRSGAVSAARPAGRRLLRRGPGQPACAAGAAHRRRRNPRRDLPPQSRVGAPSHARRAGGRPARAARRD